MLEPYDGETSLYFYSEADFPNQGEEYEILYSFVAKNERIDLEAVEGSISEGHNGPGSAVYQLVKMRSSSEFSNKLMPPTHEFALDSINAFWFIEMSKNIDDCELNNIAQSKKRHQQLAELLHPSKMPIISVLFSSESREEKSYIDNFQPSTWHKVIVANKGGVPAIRANENQIEEGEETRLIYAGPTTRQENDELFRIFCLDHILDAGI